jgi:cytochrome c oxidase accessory protein FixG
VNTTEKNIIKENIDDSYRDKIATVDKSGKRIWLYPKKPKGVYFNKRKLVSYVLLFVLFITPFLKWKGEPLMLFNVVEAKFILFGFPFTTQDFHILVIGMLMAFVGIALFTVIFGRVFCGWVCPQTIFMEMVFRRIEYWIEGDANAQIRLNKREWDTDKVLRKAAKHILFIGISVVIAHTFLSYIIGVDRVWELLTDPVEQHWSGFLSMVVFTAVFYGVFSIMREQVCTTICPYGRLQSVLLDKDSLAVSYDFVRGEPRGKLSRKRKKASSEGSPGYDAFKTRNTAFKAEEVNDSFIKIEEKIIGDCVDCNLCVKVCPTGIDIRNGTQLECVNCTACIDACDAVMEKIDKPKGLIRIDSYNGIVSGKKKLITKRAIGYSLVLVALIGLQSFMLINRSKVECLFLRTPGLLYQDLGDGYISNLYNYQLINKTREDFSVEFLVKDAPEIVFQLVGDAPIAKASSVTEGVIFIKIPKKDLDKEKTKLTIEINAEGVLIDRTKTTFFSPIK